MIHTNTAGARLLHKCLLTNVTTSLTKVQVQVCLVLVCVGDSLSSLVGTTWVGLVVSEGPKQQAVENRHVLLVVAVFERGSCTRLSSSWQHVQRALVNRTSATSQSNSVGLSAVCTAGGSRNPAAALPGGREDRRAQHMGQ